MSELVASEQQMLAEYEAVIERGLKTFVEVGRALMEIRDNRLYRDDYSNFDLYCQERWNFSKTYANNLIAGSEMTTMVVTEDAPAPASERVARELTPLKQTPEELRDAWSETVERHGPQPTAAQTREVVQEKVAGKMAVHYSSKTDEWATPLEFFATVADEFSFELDVCALDSSAKCDRYFTPEDDGLAQEWVGTCWMNPPYGDEIKHWVKKAHDSALAGATVVCLVPARTDTAWWHDFCTHGEIRLLRGRLRFGDAEASAPFPSALVVFGRPASIANWDWRA